jgi:CDP-glucose 4,6-dehydratase
MVFHLAAQPLVRRSYQHPKETFEVNVGGTVNLLEAVRKTESVRVVICVTSDKCYEPRGWEWGYREDDPLGGHDPYSASKAAAELVAAAYHESFFGAQAHGLQPVGLGRPMGLATVRAGNVIGGGDWAADRIVPDCIRALIAEEPILVRHPEAIRPWQHVLEPLAGYLLLAQRLWDDPEKYSGAWNFGPEAENARPVAYLVQELIRLWGHGHWKRADTRAESGELTCLRLSSDKAMSLLSWRPQWNLRNALKRTVDWYRAFYWEQSGSQLRSLCEQQIDEYERRCHRSFSMKSSSNDGASSPLTSPTREQELPSASASG